MEGPVRDRHRRHRRLRRSGRRQGLTPRRRHHPGQKRTPSTKRLPNTEPRLRELFAQLQAKHGTVLVVVDQSASIGAQPLAVVRDMGCPVGHIRGLTMRQIADLCPGEAKTDAKDAFIIAALRAVDGEDETSAELEMIVGFDEDLAGEATTVANRPPGLLTQIHPSLERVLGPRLQHPAVLALRERFAAPDAQGRPTSAGHAAAAESTEDGRTAGREGTSSPAAHPAPDRPHMPAPPNGAANSSRQWLFPDGPPGQHLSDTVLGRRPAAHHIPNRPRPGRRPRRPRPGPSPQQSSDDARHPRRYRSPLATPHRPRLDCPHFIHVPPAAQMRTQLWAPFDGPKCPGRCAT